MAYTQLVGTPLGPLTTTWTAPESCSWFYPACVDCDNAYAGQRCEASGGNAMVDDIRCWPPATVIAAPTPPLRGWGYYSPGIVCPDMHTAACTAVSGGKSDWEVEFRLKAGETAVGCCPVYVATIPDFVLS